MKRILATLFLFIAVYTAPWWFSIFFIALGVIYFPYYIEGILFAFFIDWLYAIYIIPSFSGVPIVGIFAFLLFAFTPMIKRRLLVY